LEELADVAPDGAVLPIGRSVFGFGLVGHDFVVGDGVRVRTRHFANVETPERRGGFKDMLLLIVDVEEVDMAGELGCRLLPGFEEAAHDGGAEGIEEKDDDGSGGQREFDGVGFDDAEDAAFAARGAPKPGVGAGDGGEVRVEFDADDGFEFESGSKQEGAAHAGSQVDECGFDERSCGGSSLPALDQGVKDRRGDAVVCG